MRALNGGRPRAAKKCMDKAVRAFASLDEIKAEEYRYWQSRLCTSGWKRLLNSL
jgi:hypothetical protein